MYKLLITYFKTLIFWILFFEGCRISFLLWSYKANEFTSISSLILSFFYGFKLDFSFASLFTLLLALMALILGQFKVSVNSILKITIYISLALYSLLTVVDLALFNKWSTKFNNQAFLYLQNPKEVLFSAQSSPLFLFFLTGAILFLLGRIVYIKIKPDFTSFRELSLKKSGLHLTVFAILLVFVRGGMGQFGYTHGTAFYSQNLTLNYASLNSGWNFFYYALNNNSVVNYADFKYFEEDTIDSLIKPLTDSAFPTAQFQNSKPKHIFLIAMESFTLQASKKGFSKLDLSPNLDNLSEEGFWFTNAFSSGDRTDKGLIALLSGYPAQPIGSIITEPDKVKELNHLPNELKKQGYITHFVYGGDPDFANMRSYLNLTGFDFITEKSDFPDKSQNSKWGAHDEYVFEKAIENVNSKKAATFTTILTLTSHEPFELPHINNPGVSEFDKFRESLKYTDSALGEFVSKLKKSGLWDESLVVITADHGHDIGLELPHPQSDQKYRIPLLITGGTLPKSYKNTVETNFLPQTTIPNLILCFLGTENTPFKWSGNFTTEQIFYSYQNGFGVTGKKGNAIFDNFSKQSTEKSPNEYIISGKAYQQKLIKDYIQK